MRIIAHFDLDAFFASVEERDNERYKNQPIVVGADPRAGKGRGVVSTANYKAREYGIHSAQPITIAWELAEAAEKKGQPAAIFLGVDMAKYAAASEEIMALIKNFVPRVEQAGIDEAYGDLSFTGSYKEAEKLAGKIKAAIKKAQRLTVSVGIAPNKFIAKIASGMNKPDGLTIVHESQVKDFLAPLPVREIPGVGPKTEMLLQKKKINTIEELREFEREELTDWLGKWGSELYDKARGGDNAPIAEEYIAKSVGEEETFLEDSQDPNFITERMMALTETVVERLAETGFREFRTIAIKIRFSGFETKTRSRTLKEPISSLKTLQFETLKLLLPFLDKRENPRRKAIRLIGVRLEKLQ